MEKKNTSALRIALIGPESTAKSTLSEKLAKHYHTLWVPEYSRIYLKELKRNYTLDDILLIAKEQFKQEEELIKKANRFIFVDTELIVAKVWCEDVFKTCPEWISETLINHPYDFYLLTYPDLPWEEDPLRENPHRRTFFYDWYEQELKRMHAAYAVIKGSGEQRLQNAVQAIEEFSSHIKNNP
jgi:NadR type nicotinamide-nucleotide adenylyltransferase